MMDWYRCTALTLYISSQARRHFSVVEDQEDATTAAWERICKNVDHQDVREMEKQAYRAIKNMYDRLRYQSMKRMADGY